MSNAIVVIYLVAFIPLFFVSVEIGRSFVRKKRPWIGFLLGLVPIYACWQIGMLMYWADTRNGAQLPDNYGPGIFISLITNLSIGMAVIYSFVVAITVIIMAWRHINRSSKIEEGANSTGEPRDEP
jgi:hypothetical protein